jgi:septin family protein
MDAMLELDAILGELLKVFILWRQNKLSNGLVENEEHCDFVKLREAILRVNEDALRERTHNVLYERYRRERFGQMKLADGDAGPKMMQSSIQVSFVY